MACPTCNVTMQNIGIVGKRVFWCPRCGTLKEEALKSDFVNIEVPRWIKMVGECKQWEVRREYEIAQVNIANEKNHKIIEAIPIKSAEEIKEALKSGYSGNITGQNQQDVHFH